MAIAEPRKGGGTGHQALSIEDLLSNSIIVDKDLIVELYQGFEKLLRFVGGLLYQRQEGRGGNGT